MTDPAPDRTRESKPAAPAQITTHPEFTNPEDITLRSADNVRFNIARRDLERTSGWFRDMFEAVNRTSSDDASEEIPVSEDAAALEAILTIALGREVSPEAISTVPACESALSAAIKYQMDGVVQVLKRTLECILWRNKDAWEQFILASRYGLELLRIDALERCIGDRLDYDNLTSLEQAQLLSFLKERHARTQDLVGVIQSYSSGQPVSNPFWEFSRGSCTTCSAQLSSGVATVWNAFCCRFIGHCTTFASADRVFAMPDVKSYAWSLERLTCQEGHEPFHDLQSRVATGIEARGKERVAAGPTAAAV